ncbi:hypothetical protein E5Q_01639 [Mixia osmundae IAM 14324]|uniref:SH3 domain-containing protein n=1 Tax=Mixia osmundae (strain CBS 9802 / IAM 14324 / JCM 22182 / KY 12970) TaxID=764103 RepID=G7DWM4_MIXOS|nr:hypothetical protein E5Q_01639 [Mixia osmundae IAM 14324]
MASAAYVDHLISRLRADVDFLEKHNHLSEADAQTIRTKLRYAGTSTASTDLASTAAPSIASLTQETNNLALAVPSPPAASRLPVTPPARPALPVRSDKPRTKALWSYTGQTPDDLTFNEGDIIEVIKVENEHWERGTCLRTGQTGLYPTNHVERLPDTNRSTSSFNSIPPPPPMNTYNSYQQQQPYSAPPPPGWQGQPINEKWTTQLSAAAAAAATPACASASRRAAATQEAWLPLGLDGQHSQAQRCWWPWFRCRQRSRLGARPWYLLASLIMFCGITA